MIVGGDANVGTTNDLHNSIKDKCWAKDCTLYNYSTSLSFLRGLSCENS
mgnify:FL=1